MLPATQIKTTGPVLAAARPFLRWVGGKQKLAPTLQAHAPPAFATYYEPFIGAGALFFALQPKVAVLGDANAQLVTTYRALASEPAQVFAKLERLATQYTQAPERTYSAVRALAPGELDTSSVAARFIFLNRTCFNGIYRVNRAGKFNVPAGKFKTPPVIFDCDGLLAVSAALQPRACQITCADFETTLASVAVGDFVYCDPPYIPLSRTSAFTKYTQDGFGMADQTRLRDIARRLHERGARVLISNSDTPATRELYADAPFTITAVDVGRSAGAASLTRKTVSELLIKTY